MLRILVGVAVLTRAKRGLTHCLHAGAVYTPTAHFVGQQNEGINSRLHYGYFTARAATCRQVLDKLIRVGAVLLRSPPATGKTSLCQLIVRIANLSPTFQAAYYVSCAAVTPSKTFTHVWATFYPGVSFSAAAASPPSSPDTSQFSSDGERHKESGHRKLIVVDEAQRMYDPEASGSRELWDCLKQGAVVDTKVVFLFAAAHGSNPSAVAGVGAATPYQFGPDQILHLR